MALSFLDPPLTSCCISNEIQELTSSAPLFLKSHGFLPLDQKGHTEPSSYSSVQRSSPQR